MAMMAVLEERANLAWVVGDPALGGVLATQEPLLALDVVVPACEIRLVMLGDGISHGFGPDAALLPLFPAASAKEVSLRVLARRCHVLFDNAAQGAAADFGKEFAKLLAGKRACMAFGCFVPGWEVQSGTYIRDAVLVAFLIVTPTVCALWVGSFCPGPNQLPIGPSRHGVLAWASVPVVQVIFAPPSSQWSTSISL